MGFAFEVAADDVVHVLRRYSLRVAASQGKSFDVLAEELLADEIDAGAVERAALDSGTDIDEQTDGAHAEIKRQLEEAGSPTAHREAETAKAHRG